MKRKTVAFITAAATAAAFLPSAVTATAEYPLTQMEYLDRGTVAVQTSDGVYLSWRLLGTENYDTAFDIYRDGTYIATVRDSTNYKDTEVGGRYTVVPAGAAVSEGKAAAVNSEQYITIPLDVPEGGISLDNEEYTYSPNDVTPADVDGDGEYELILKWEPSNSFDSGKNAKHNGNVYIDCYKLSGEKLWRIDMGININAGAHFTQMAAYDFDLDGKAELALKTAPGTVDCIVFNFGRLPGGDPHIFTTAATSLPAIDAGLALLRPGGVMALALYYGKENGYAERDAVLAHLRALDDRRFTVLVCDWLNRRNDPPLPIFVWKDAN